MKQIYDDSIIELVSKFEGRRKNFKHGRIYLLVFKGEKIYFELCLDAILRHFRIVSRIYGGDRTISMEKLYKKVNYSLLKLILMDRIFPEAFNSFTLKNPGKIIIKSPFSEPFFVTFTPIYKIGEFMIYESDLISKREIYIILNFFRESSKFSRIGILNNGCFISGFLFNLFFKNFNF